jgi:pilus assembly protein CpaF
VWDLARLEPLLADPSISDILVNGCNSTYIERAGKLSEVPVRFRDDDHLMLIINRIVSRVGRRIDETSPMVDARLADGSRVNAIIPPLALDGEPRQGRMKQSRQIVPKSHPRSAWHGLIRNHFCTRK